MSKQEIQLELFPEKDLPRLNDTEEALLYYMKKSSELEQQVRELEFELYGEWKSTFDIKTAKLESLGSFND